MKDTVHPVDEVINQMKEVAGFAGFVICNNDGVVLRHENVEPRDKGGIHHAYHALDLCNKARDHVRILFEAPENELESVRLKTDDYEMIISQVGSYTLCVMQKPAAELEAAAEGEEGEEKAE